MSEEKITVKKIFKKEWHENDQHYVAVNLETGIIRVYHDVGPGHFLEDGLDAYLYYFIVLPAYFDADVVDDFITDNLQNFQIIVDDATFDLDHRGALSYRFGISAKKCIESMESQIEKISREVYGADC